MAFREDLDEVVHRTRAFHASPRVGTALIEVASIDDRDGTVPPLDLTQWSFPAGMKDYLRATFERHRRLWGLRRTLRDDRIPSVQPWYGIAEHSAYAGGEVTFTPNTSYHHPFLKDWDDLPRLRLDEGNPWRRMLDDGFAYLSELAAGECPVSLRGSYSPLEVANSVRGNDLFTDFYEFPDEVRSLMEFATRAVAWNVACQKKAVGSFAGGVLSGFKSWIPGDSFGQISEDTTTISGPRLYEEFGLPCTRRALAGNERLFVHTHSVGAASIGSILKLGNVYMLEVSSDPNADRGIEVFKRLDPDPGIVGVLALTLREIEENIGFLKARKTVIWHYAADMEEAERAVALVRRELPPA